MEMTEHHRWGPIVFGGGHADHRDAQQARADLRVYEAEHARLSELCVYDRSLEDDCAYLGNLVSWTKTRLDFLDTQRGEARRQALANAQEDEVRARHGLPPKDRELTVDGYREVQHRQEQESLAPTLNKTRAELDAIDPKLKTKAQLKAELDAIDPVVQAKLGKPFPDAITVMRAGRKAAVVLDERERAVKALDDLYATLPEMDCKGFCAVACKQIPMSAVELERIERPRGPVGEYGPNGTCPMLTSEQRCSVMRSGPWSAASSARVR
jgi:hypothetical protein